MKPARTLAFSWLLAWLALSVVARGTGEHDLPRALLSPSLAHPFGFDAFGREMLGLTLRGSTFSILFAGSTSFLSIALALLVGATLAVAPAWLSRFPVVALEFLLAFPSLIFALALAAVVGAGWWTLAASLAIGALPGATRLFLARSRELLLEDFVESARAVGARPARIVLRHLLPELARLARVKAPNAFAHALVAEATLTFLGVGAPAGRDTWGALLLQGKDYLIEAPHIAAFSGLPLVLTVLSLQWLSESAERGVR